MLHFNVRGGSQLLDEGFNRVSSSVRLDSQRQIFSLDQDESWLWEHHVLHKQPLLLSIGPAGSV